MLDPPELETLLGDNRSSGVVGEEGAARKKPFEFDNDDGEKCPISVVW